MSSHTLVLVLHQTIPQNLIIQRTKTSSPLICMHNVNSHFNLTSSSAHTETKGLMWEYRCEHDLAYVEWINICLCFSGFSLDYRLKTLARFVIIECFVKAVMKISLGEALQTALSQLSNYHDTHHEEMWNSCIATANWEHWPPTGSYFLPHNPIFDLGSLAHFV